MRAPKAQATFLEVFLAKASDEAAIVSGVGPFEFADSADPVLELDPDYRDSRGLRFRKQIDCAYYTRCIDIAVRGAWVQFTCDGCSIGSAQRELRKVVKTDGC